MKKNTRIRIISISLMVSSVILLAISMSFIEELATKIAIISSLYLIASTILYKDYRSEQ